MVLLLLAPTTTTTAPGAPSAKPLLLPQQGHGAPSRLLPMPPLPPLRRRRRRSWLCRGRRHWLPVEGAFRLQILVHHGLRHLFSV